MNAWMHFAACAVIASALAGCGASGSTEDPGNPGDTLVTISVLSSPSDYVSGGDARIEVKAPPGLFRRLTFWLNGNRIFPAMTWADGHLEGVVSGLLNGKNILEVRHLGAQGKDVSGSIELTNYPIIGPMFTGPQQELFICRTEESGLGQPQVDNHQGIGHPVFDESTGQLVGHSKHCSIETRFQYIYYNGTDFKRFDPATGFKSPPPDLQTIKLNGVEVPFVVRIEGGTINRFIYTVAMLAPFPEPVAPGRMNNAAWNDKLVYWLRGGGGIGHQQGTAMWFNNGLTGTERTLMPQILARGFAVVTSSGNEAGVHYNMRLAEETAMMTKEHFSELYGKPRFTIGLGGSGGGVQQYLFAQNRPGLLDGGIPAISYPDMVTQTIPISDCPLLGQYFKDEVALNPASPWAKWSNQKLIEGMNASDTVLNVISRTPGSTECINGWLSAIPTVLNPVYKDSRYDIAAKDYGYPHDVFANVKWTHWNDLANIYGADSDGHAPISIDNVGVQYGLAALADGQISTGEFLRMNACVGGWKEQPGFAQWDRQADPFDSRNMQRSANCRDAYGTPAPRRSGDLRAMRLAYTSGHVFTGRRLDIPMIDLRPYLEPELDMHNSRQSFSVRARLLDANAGGVKNQVIWFTGSEDDLLPRVMDALSVLDRYLSSGAAPVEFTDRCMNASGALIAAGPSVWNGILNGKAPGACTKTYPIHSSPRMVAGDSINGLIFKCTLKPVSAALADGTYPATRQFSAQQRTWLARIFPEGVCDFSRGDQGLPPSW